MSKVLRGYAVAATGARATFLASTHSEGRDGLTIERGAWDLANYRKNPIVLLSHNYFEPPIGRTTKLTETDAGLVAEIEWDTADPKAAEIARKYRDGYMSAVSVGWSTLEQDGMTIKRTELLDISAVSVPGDPNALATARAAFRSLGAPADVRPFIDPVAFRAFSESEQERLLLGIRLALVNFEVGRTESRVRQLVAEGVRQWARS